MAKEGKSPRGSSYQPGNEFDHLVRLTQSAVQERVLDELRKPSRTPGSDQHATPHTANGTQRHPFPGAYPWSVHRAPYTGGTPHPEKLVATPGNAHGAWAYNIEGYSDFENGLISVGIQGGVIDSAAWTGQRVETELPDRWPQGDQISSAASIWQNINLPDRPHALPRYDCFVDFGWRPPAPVLAGSPDDYLYACVDLRSGGQDAALSGFTAVTGSLFASMNFLRDGVPVKTFSTRKELLSVGVNSSHPGQAVFVQGPYLFRNFAFADSGGHPITVHVTGTLPLNANELIVEAGVILCGLRGGVKDPHGGWLSAVFMNIFHGATQMSWHPADPISVDSINLLVS